MSSVHRRGPAAIEANLTPMIDMTFLLVVFFVLVSQISEVEVVEMELPEPRPTASAPPPEETRSVLNVVPDEAGQASASRLNGINFAIGDEGVAALRSALVKLYHANPELRINLRADRRTEQRFIDPILNAITGAASTSGRSTPARVNLVVTTTRGIVDA
jgi:biopolymer transport protein ExbD